MEIGAIKFDRKGIIARFSTLINPGIPIPEAAARVNNISDTMLEGKPCLDDVMPDFLMFIDTAILTAHNAPFDCGFINERLKKLCGEKADLPGGLIPPIIPNQIADTLLISREVFPGRRSYSLQNLAADMGLPAASAHRAEDDAALCMGILVRCIEALRAGPSG